MNEVAVRAPAFWLNLAVKAALVGRLAFAVARHDLPPFDGKAMVGRALTCPIAVLGLAGSVLAATVAVTVLWPKRS